MSPIQTSCGWLVGLVFDKRGERRKQATREKETAAVSNGMECGIEWNRTTRDAQDKSVAQQEEPSQVAACACHCFHTSPNPRLPISISHSRGKLKRLEPCLCRNVEQPIPPFRRQQSPLCISSGLQPTHLGRSNEMNEGKAVRLAVYSRIQVRRLVCVQRTREESGQAPGDQGTESVGIRLSSSRGA